MLLSVIIPVYNSEVYLQHCLDSIRCQSFSDYEVILVDDGSTDCSKDICLKYTSKDTRFRYYRRPENGGASAARNDGIRLSSGLYILFIDSDDWLSGDGAFDELHRTIRQNNEPDLVAWPMGEYLENSGDTNMPLIALSNSINDINYEAAVLTLLRNNNYYSSASGKIVKRSLVTSHSLCFKTALKHNEDSDWSLNLLYYANSIKWIDSSYYVYRRDSLTSTSSKAVCSNVVASLNSIIENHVKILAEKKLDAIHITVSNNFAAYIYVLLLANIYSLPNPTERSKWLSQQKKFSWLLSYDAQMRVKLAKWIGSIFGVNILGYLLSKAMQLEKQRLTKY